MFRSEIIAVCVPILGLVPFYLCESAIPLACAAEPSASAGLAAQPGPLSGGHTTPEERRMRAQRVSAISGAELERELAEAGSLDADVGIPLLRLQAQCRVALEHLKLQIDYLSSLPEVRHADDVLSRPEFKARLAALRSKTPTEMEIGYRQFYEKSNLKNEEVELLCSLRLAAKTVP